MNRGRRIKYLRKFILKHGTLYNEKKRPPDKWFPPYRKGSYSAVFVSYDNSLETVVGDCNKYEVYKEIAKQIRSSMSKS